MKLDMLSTRELEFAVEQFGVSIDPGKQYGEDELLDIFYKLEAFEISHHDSGSEELRICADIVTKITAHSDW